MATLGSYFLNGPSLGSCTSVFLDISLTTLAPDGFYSDGVTSREQVVGVLLPEALCGTCGVACGESISGSGGTGIYLLNTDAGSTIANVGAIIITFNPASVPDGIRATYNGNIYNTLSSPADGLHRSTNPSGFTIAGRTSGTSSCSSSWYPAGGNVTLNEFLYTGGSFVSTGNSQTIPIAAGDISLSAVPTGPCVMVIPKVYATPSLLNLELLGPCGSTVFSINVNCPSLLPSFSSSIVSSSADCFVNLTELYYFAKVHEESDTYVGLYDYVFEDAYGVTPLADGFYLIENVDIPRKSIEVQDGIVIGFTDCSSYLCREYTAISSGGGPGTVFYVDCLGDVQDVIIENETIVFCANQGTVTVSPGISLIENGPCPA
jgi:hypothetical protein